MNNNSHESIHSSSNDDALAQLVRKAEMQQKQIELELRFNNNMELFKKVAPELYERFHDYQPEELRLSYSTEGYVQLVNFKLDNKPVYPEDPEVFSGKQYQEFCKKPNITAVTFGKTQGQNPRYIHVPLLNEIIEKYQPEAEDLKTSVDVPIGLMLVTGTGLGYHIRDLSKDLNIVNLMIYDPHPDSFYASLHTIDWQPILTKYCQRGKMIKLFIGHNEKDAMTEMKRLSDKIGLHNMVLTYVFRHFNSQEEESFIDLYRKEFHLNATGTGYFDDEQISLAHTISHLKQGRKIFTPHYSDQNLPPVFIIGNGPSLDLHIDYIKEQQDSAILISCGTALGSLYKIGIKPDFHIEMERIKKTVDWIKKGSPDSFRKDIMMLGLNTCPPIMLDNFGDCAIAKKPNDLGEAILDNELKLEHFQPLALCNPTVANAGLSYALAMGFRDVYFLGVDMGIPQDKHHSKLSIYNDLEDASKKDVYKIFNYKRNDYEVDANFGGKVLTNAVLHSSKSNLEILIRMARQKMDNLQVYNANNGAKIDGAEPVRREDLPKFEKIDNKAQALEKIKQINFKTIEPQDNIEEDFRAQYLQTFFDLRKDLGLSKSIDNINDLHAAINEIYVKVVKLKDSNPVTMMLLRGSLNGFFTIMIKALTFTENRAEFLEKYKGLRKNYMTLIKEIYQFMETTPYMQDDSTQEVLDILEDK